jgi:chromosome segregation ATPase
MNSSANDSRMHQLAEELKVLTTKHSNKMKELSEHGRGTMEELRKLGAKFEERKDHLLKEQRSETERFESSAKTKHNDIENEIKNLASQIQRTQNDIDRRQDELARAERQKAS